MSELRLSSAPPPALVSAATAPVSAAARPPASVWGGMSVETVESSIETVETTASIPPPKKVKEEPVDSEIDFDSLGDEDLGERLHRHRLEELRAKLAALKAIQPASIAQPHRFPPLPPIVALPQLEPPVQLLSPAPASRPRPTQAPWLEQQLQLPPQPHSPPVRPHAEPPPAARQLQLQHESLPGSSDDHWRWRLCESLGAIAKSKGRRRSKKEKRKKKKKNEKETEKHAKMTWAMSSTRKRTREGDSRSHDSSRRPAVLLRCRPSLRPVVQLPPPSRPGATARTQHRRMQRHRQAAKRAERRSGKGRRRSGKDRRPSGKAKGQDRRRSG